ncbi:MAG: Type 1 glutamine amidotransferase-like domain-containing protein [Nanoarchaeota archaeon]|nr:Type 1 glutamine amidotransferase-like domain-containing protein [Nanoarchaeota archaeon]
MKIVAIGGGEIGRPGYKIETREIDKEIIKLTGKEHPRALLLPTASGDSPLYWETFNKYYGKDLGCKTDVLYLIKEKPSKEQIEDKIISSDIIYVGGGNTLRMLKAWRRFGVDKILERAAQEGKILSGVSAGAICWFRYGNSDSMRFGPSKNKRLIKLKGLNFIDLMLCPHYDVEKDRRASLKKMVKKYKMPAIALDNCTALEIIEDKYRIIKSEREANAYMIYIKNSKVIEEKILSKKEFSSLENLKC